MLEDSPFKVRDVAGAGCVKALHDYFACGARGTSNACMLLARQDCQAHMVSMVWGLPLAPRHDTFTGDGEVDFDAKGLMVDAGTACRRDICRTTLACSHASWPMNLNTSYLHCVIFKTCGLHSSGNHETNAMVLMSVPFWCCMRQVWRLRCRCCLHGLLPWPHRFVSQLQMGGATRPCMSSFWPGWW